MLPETDFDRWYFAVRDLEAAGLSAYKLSVAKQRRARLASEVERAAKRLAAAAGALRPFDETGGVVAASKNMEICAARASSLANELSMDITEARAAWEVLRQASRSSGSTTSDTRGRGDGAGADLPGSPSGQAGGVVFSPPLGVGPVQQTMMSAAEQASEFAALQRRRIDSVGGL